MKGKRIILYLLLLIIGFSVGYFLKPTIITAPVEYLPSEKNEDTKIPECSLEGCPQYQAMVVDKNLGFPASVITYRTAMTQGAGKVIIVKNGKILFDSGEMPGIGIDSVDDGDGFILHYSSPRDENLNNIQYSVRYKYRDGQFIEVSD